MADNFRIVMACLACAIVCGSPGATQAKTQAKKLTAAQIAACDRKFHIDVNGSDSKGWHQPANGTCHVQLKDGHRFPDPFCTPGALNPSVTETVLRSKGFTTQCIRNRAESESAKSIVYQWYGLSPDSTCEKDHFIPLEIGGADTLDNIWPQCGPEGSQGQDRDFKQKDSVELYLGKQVKAGMSQNDAREAIARDWPALMSDAAKPAPGRQRPRAR